MNPTQCESRAAQLECASPKPARNPKCQCHHYSGPSVLVPADRARPGLAPQQPWRSMLAMNVRVRSGCYQILGKVQIPPASTTAESIPMAIRFNAMAKLPGLTWPTDPCLEAAFRALAASPVTLPILPPLCLYRHCSGSSDAAYQESIQGS